MKKYYQILCLLMISILAAGFTACSDDDDDDDSGSSELQGTWVFDRGTATVMGYTNTIHRSDLKNLASQMGVSGFWDETLIFKGNKVNGVEYRVKGNKFEFKGAPMPEGVNMDITFKVEGDVLILHYIIKVSGYEYTCDLYYDRD